MKDVFELTLRDIYVKNNIHWQTEEQLLSKWEEGTAHITKTDALEAMREVFKSLINTSR